MQPHLVTVQVYAGAKSGVRIAFLERNTPWQPVMRLESLDGRRCLPHKVDLHSEMLSNRNDLAFVVSQVLKEPCHEVFRPF